MAEDDVGGAGPRFLPESLQSLLQKAPGLGDTRAAVALLTADNSQRSTINSLNDMSRHSVNQVRQTPAAAAADACEARSEPRCCTADAMTVASSATAYPLPAMCHHVPPCGMDLHPSSSSGSSLPHAHTLLTCTRALCCTPTLPLPLPQDRISLPADAMYLLPPADRANQAAMDVLKNPGAHVPRHSPAAAGMTVGPQTKLADTGKVWRVLACVA
jgi:hypothetical protein